MRGQTLAARMDQPQTGTDSMSVKIAQYVTGNTIPFRRINAPWPWIL